jgi:hypothetical protein
MTILMIPITKADKRMIELDTEKVPEATYKYALELGFKAILNRGQTTTSQDNFPSAKAFQDAIFTIAEKQLADVYAGKTRMVGATKGPKEGKRSERYVAAIEICRAHVKSQWKASGQKMVGISAKTWTETATAQFNTDPDFWLARADAVIAARAVETAPAIDLGLIKADPKAIAKAEKAAADKKKKAEAKAKGKTPPPVKAKPATRPHA